MDRRSAKRRSDADLVVYYSWDDAVSRALLEAFSKRSGKRITGMRRSSRHMAKLIEAERREPVASVVVSGSGPSYEMLRRAGLLAPYVPRGARAIPKQFRDPGGAWTGIYLGVIGFGSDPARVARPPRSYAELLRVGRTAGIVYANPATSGTAYSFLLGLIGIYGERGAFDYLARLHPAVVEIPSSGSTAPRLVSLGAAGVALGFAHDIVRTSHSGRKLALSFPAEGTGWEIGGAALIRGAPSPELGKRLLDFLCEPATQELIWRASGSPVYPTHPRAASPPGMPPFDEVERVRIDIVEAGRRWDERALRWNRRFPRGE